MLFTEEILAFHQVNRQRMEAKMVFYLEVDFGDAKNKVRDKMHPLLQLI